MVSFKGLKGLFKRNKKSKQDQEAAKPDRAAAAAKPQAAPKPTTANLPAAKPPQLPPVQNASPLQSPGSETLGKPIPPTHPIATGPHSQPQEAVPQNHDAQPGPPAPPALNVTRKAETEDKAAKPEEASPLESKTGVEGAKAETNTGLQNNNPLAPPPTTTPPSTEQATAGETAAKELNNPLAPPGHADSGIGMAEKDGLDEKVPTSTEHTNAISDEKVAVAHEEPPPIKPVQAAPGMSATSGPLEDFPEGGEHLSED